MKIVFLAFVAAAMGWAVWKFISGLTAISPTDRDSEAGSRSDGTWNS
jgi:hypothetical protein